MNISQLLQLAIERSASDLHLSAGLPPMLRIDGDLLPLDQPALQSNELQTVANTVLNETEHQQLMQNLEIDSAYALSENQRFRLNIFHQQGSLAAAFRVIPSQIPSLQQLNCPEIFVEFCRRSQGLILITGPTGSGKSTTLAALLNHINHTQRKHIISIEDPIEFIYHSQQCMIQQRQVHRDTLGFSVALRSALREDPDIISVGELRDLETIRLALTAAETGHLVLATLHTQSAAKTIDRLVDVFPGNEKELVRAMLAESLYAVISQMLLKKPQGGRVAAQEILIATPAIRHLIRENKTAQICTVMQTGQAMGMCTMEQCVNQLKEKQILHHNNLAV
jgi:twitching motility protein PilT